MLDLEVQVSNKAPAAQCDLIMPGRPDQSEALEKGVEEGNTVYPYDL